MKKLTFFLPLVLYAFFVSSDEKYFVHSDQNATIIYAKDNANEAKKALKSYRAVSNYYNRSFSYTPSTKPHIVLASRQNQIANAWATAIPYPQITLYGAGSLQLDYFGFDSWIDSIVAHETTHIYQLDNKNGIPKTLESIFGHNAMPIFAPIPLFTKPNIFLPDFILEGNALYNESKITRSGRMYSGKHKALVMALAKSGKLNATRLLNNHRDFPYMEEKYIVGGYFQEFLDGGNLDRFFAVNSKHFINPFLLDRSFKRNFNKGFYKNLDSFIEDLTIRSDEFVLQQGVDIALSKAYAPIGSDEDKIVIFSSDLEKDTEIVLLDKKTKKRSLVKGDFFVGKPFCFDTTCATVASGYTSTNKIETGLFDKDKKPLKQLNSKILQDIYNGNILYIDTQKSYDYAKLYENSVFIGEVVSTAKYSPDGTIYTIRKNGNFYTLYAGSDAVFSLRSHFTIADIDDKKRVLFVANSRYGSGLFIYSDGKISRALNGDNILDAAWFDNASAVVTTVTADGYKSLLAKIKPTDELPIKTAFEFDKTAKLDLRDQRDLMLKEKPYSSLKMLKFSNIYPFIYMGNRSIEGSLDANFIDPLMHNSLNIGYIHGEKAYAYAGYHNKKHRLYFGATYYSELNNTRSYDERDYGADIYLGYKFLKTNTKDIDLTFRQIHDPDSKLNTPNIAQFSYIYGTKKPLAFKENRSFSLDLMYKENSDKNDEKAYGYRAQLGAKILGQTYIDLMSRYSKIENGYLMISEAKAIKDPLNFELINMPIVYKTKDISSTKGTLTTAIKSPIYFTQFPFAIHRSAPKISYERLDLANGRYTIEESVFALEAQMLFAHRFDFNIELGVAKNSETKDNKFYFMLKVE